MGSRPTQKQMNSIYRLTKSLGAGTSTERGIRHALRNLGERSDTLDMRRLSRADADRVIHQLRRESGERHSNDLFSYAKRTSGETHTPRVTTPERRTVEHTNPKPERPLTAEQKGTDAMRNESTATRQYNSVRDTDGDGLPGVIDRDDDNDRIPDVIDRDDDGDGVPDVIDRDDNGNGVPDAVEALVATRAESRSPILPMPDPDIAEDQIFEHFDQDDDNDNLPNAVDIDSPVATEPVSGEIEKIVVHDVDGDGDPELTAAVSVDIDGDGDTDAMMFLQDDDMDGVIDSIQTNVPVVADLDGDSDADAGALVNIDLAADGDTDVAITIEDDDMDRDPDVIERVEPAVGDLDLDGDVDVGAIVRIDHDADGDTDITSIRIDEDIDGDIDKVIPLPDANGNILDDVDYEIKEGHVHGDDEFCMDCDPEPISEGPPADGSLPPAIIDGPLPPAIIEGEPSGEDEPPEEPGQGRRRPPIEIIPPEPVAGDPDPEPEPPAIIDVTPKGRGPDDDLPGCDLPPTPRGDDSIDDPPAMVDPPMYEPPGAEPPAVIDPPVSEPTLIIDPPSPSPKPGRRRKPPIEIIPPEPVAGDPDPEPEPPGIIDVPPRGESSAPEGPAQQGTLGSDFATNQTFVMAFDRDVTREVEREKIVDVEAYRNRPLPGQTEMLDKDRQDDVALVVVESAPEPESAVVVVGTAQQPEPTIVVVESIPDPEPSLVVVESAPQPEPVVIVQEAEPAPPAEPVIVVVREELVLPDIPPDPPEPRRKEKSKDQVVREATRRALLQTSPRTNRSPGKKKSEGAKRRSHPFLTRAESRRH